MEPQCQALNLSDQKRCPAVATQSGALFCAYHAKQCYGLYRGYKSRNKRLDRLLEQQPEFLAKNKTPLINQAFKDVKDEAILKDLHEHLFTRYALVDRVLRARKLHHSRFYSLKLDYGHQAYLDKLEGQRTSTLRALERLERRTAEVLYERRKWFKWVSLCQDEEDKHRIKEKDKVRREAELFQRQWKQLEARLKKLREKENARRQDDFLEQAYQERMASSDDSDEEGWDPIEDMIRNERESYIELIRHFLWMPKLADADSPEIQPREDSTNSTAGETGPAPAEATNEPDTVDTSSASTTIAAKKSKKARQKAQKAEKKSQTNTTISTTTRPTTAQNDELGSLTSLALSDEAIRSKLMKARKPTQEAETVTETREEVHKRLKDGVDYDKSTLAASGASSVMMGTIEIPIEPTKEAYQIPEDEILVLLDEIAEIKQLLFCRILLSHATLLPAALGAGSVEDFLADAEISDADLRDLMLKMEQPGLQQIRDACADFARDRDESSDDEDEKEELVQVNKKQQKNRASDRRLRPGHSLTREWKSNIDAEKKESRKRQNVGGTVIDFGKIDDTDGLKQQKLRVTVCGRDIWNYASDNVMSRHGWLQFSIIAKGTRLYSAMELCRTWKELYEVNSLAQYSYFPSSLWASWANDIPTKELWRLGFFTYFRQDRADDEQLWRSLANKGGSAAALTVQSRGFICGTMNRLSSATRRFISYVNMHYHQLFIMVRDGHTGEVLIEPANEEDCWLTRMRAPGRRGKNAHHVLSQVGDRHYEAMDGLREWRLSFDQYYDIVIWDRHEGQAFTWLLTSVRELLIKANKLQTMRDMYTMQEPLLRSLTRDPNRLRTRDTKPGEETLWDFLQTKTHSRALAVDTNGKVTDTEFRNETLYSDVDLLEDKALFPEEYEDAPKQFLRPGATNELERLEDGELPWNRFIHDLDTDDDSWDEDSIYEHSINSDIKADAMDADQKKTNGASVDGEDAWEDELGEEFFEKMVLGEEILGLMDEIKDTGTLKDLVDVMRWRMFERDEPKLRKAATKYLGKKATTTKQSDKILDQWLDDPDYPMRDLDDMDTEFPNFVERHKAKLFKNSFHLGDLEEGAQLRYVQSNELYKAAAEQYFAQDSHRLTILQTLQWLGVHPEAHRHVGKDITIAYAMTALLFDDGDHFGKAKPGGVNQFLKDLIDQKERCKALPNVRSATSCFYRPKPFYQELDTKNVDVSKVFAADVRYNYPIEWDEIVRPTIAKLFKAGMIKPSPYATGPAFIAQEPGRSRPDLFIDFRPGISDQEWPDGMVDPTRLPALKIFAKRFAELNHGARFSLLRVWSAPHFYPLMIGYEKRAMSSFTDGLGRSWEWKFLPKDLSRSEWSMHLWCRNTFEKSTYAPLLRGKVVCNTDKILVMAKNAEELRKLTTAVIYLAQTRPWLKEIDLWKSFVNVDLDFLQSLDDRWTDVDARSQKH